MIVLAVYLEGLVSEARRADCVIEFAAQVGDFVATDEPLFFLYGNASAVDERRLWQRHLQLAQLGAREDGGVNRQALSHEDGLARVQLKAWAEESGYGFTADEIGNVFIRREGLDPALRPVLIGSHLDSQPAGGKFDGASGVLAALEARPRVGVGVARVHGAQEPGRQAALGLEPRERVERTGGEHAPEVEQRGDDLIGLPLVEIGG